MNNEYKEYVLKVFKNLYHWYIVTDRRITCKGYVGGKIPFMCLYEFDKRVYVPEHISSIEVVFTSTKVNEDCFALVTRKYLTYYGYSHPYVVIVGTYDADLMASAEDTLKEQYEKGARYVHIRY